MKIRSVFLSLIFVTSLFSTPSESNNNFALDIFNQMMTQQGNRLYSPLSALTVLAMTSLGAEGRTQEEMEAVLYIPEHSEDWHREFGQTLGAIVSDRENQSWLADWWSGEKSYTFRLANKVYVDETRDLTSGFESALDAFYHADPGSVDFQFDTEGSRLLINEWVKESTQGKISDLFPSGSIDEMTRLALVSALYFKADWAATFVPEHTKEEEFKLLDGKKTTVQMMFRSGRYLAYQHRDYTALEMPFNMGDDEARFVMRVYLPKEDDGIDFVQNALVRKRDLLEEVSWELHTVQLWFPRFKIEDSQKLTRNLKTLGMSTPFSQQADFSRMTGPDDLSISTVVQKTFFEVDEFGAEGAAATGVAMMTRSLGPPPVNFRADHPFLFTVVEKSSGLIVFIGRVENP